MSGGDFDVDFLDLAEEASGELVAEGYFDGEFGVLGRLLPGAFEHEGAQGAEGAPARPQSTGVEGPVANAVVAGQIQVENVNFDAPGGFDAFVSFIGRREINFQTLVGLVDAIAGFAAGETAEPDAVDSEEFFEAIRRESGKRAGLPLQTGNAGAGGVELPLEVGELRFELLFVLAELDVGFAGMDAAGKRRGGRGENDE